jgi:hypothetical protein
VRSIPMAAAPEPWPALVMYGSSTPILQLPGSPRQSEPVAIYRAALARRTLVNGYSGYFPPEHRILMQALSMYDLSVLDGLRAQGPLQILLDRSVDDRGRFARRLQSSHPAMTASDRRWILFELPPLRPTAPAPVSGAQVRPIAVRASLNDDLAWRAADGRVETGWYTDIQRPGHTLTLDFGRLVSGTALRLEGGRPLDYPRLLEIDRSGGRPDVVPRLGRAGGGPGLAGGHRIAADDAADDPARRLPWALPAPPPGRRVADPALVRRRSVDVRAGPDGRENGGRHHLPSVKWCLATFLR